MCMSFSVCVCVCVCRRRLHGAVVGHGFPGNSRIGGGGGYTVVAAGVCTSSLIPRPHPQKEGKGSSELGLNPSFLVYGARQQGHAKVGSDWSLWHVIATCSKANRLEPDWSAKLNSYTAIQ